jgi:hypothetical protein
VKPAARRGAPVAAVSIALALGAGCEEAARGLRAGPGGAAAATSVVDAIRSRYGKVEREPGLEGLRPKLESAALVPSRVFDDASVWTVSEGDWRALWLEGSGSAGAYRLGVRPAPALPRTPGEYRGRIALRRQKSGSFEWTTFDELALGPLRPADLAVAFHALLQAAEGERGDARPRLTAAMPRSTRALGRLYDLEVLSLSPDAEGTLRIEVALRLQPDRLKAEAPKFAAYVARRARGLRLGIVATVPDGRPLWSVEAEDARWRLRLRTRHGRLVPLEGPPGHEAGRLRMTVDYSFKAGLFRVGVRGLVAELDPAPGPDLAFAVRFATQPEWQLPFLVEPFVIGSLRYPFEEPGSRFSLAMREEPGRGSLLVTDSRLQVKESWIIRWLGGISTKALAELRAAEAEADRYALECLTAIREDLAALVTAPPAS